MRELVASDKRSPQCAENLFTRVLTVESREYFSKSLMVAMLPDEPSDVTHVAR